MCLGIVTDILLVNEDRPDCLFVDKQPERIVYGCFRQGGYGRKKVGIYLIYCRMIQMLQHVMHDGCPLKRRIDFIAFQMMMNFLYSHGLNFNRYKITKHFDLMEKFFLQS